MAWAWAPKTNEKRKSDDGDATRGAPRAEALLRGPLALPLPSAAALALASGLLAALSVRSLASPVLTLVALTPLFVACHRAAPRRALALGWLAASVASFGGYAFVAPALSATGRLSPFLAWCALAAFSLFRGAWLGIAFAAAAHFPRRSLALAPLFVVATELVLPNPLPFAFGTPLVMWPPIAQIASVVGASGLTFVAALVSAGVAALVIGGRRSWRRTWRVIAAGAVAPTVATIFGLARLENTPRNEAMLSATLVHTTRDARHPGSAPAIPAGRELVLLPESAIAEPLPTTDSDALARELLSPASPTLFGLSERASDGRLRNVALFLEPDTAAASGRYEKRALLPFAESAFEPGRPSDPITVEGVPISVAICSEELHADVVRAGVEERDARAIVALGNDAWFAGGFAVELHLLAAQVRAIESNRSVLRSSNAGITAAIDPYGRVIARTTTPGPLDVRVPTSTATTPYLRWGNIPLWVLLAGLLLSTRTARST